MNHPCHCRIVPPVETPEAGFSAERRHFLKGMLPVRRHTVTITFPAAASRHATPCHAAKLAV